MSESQTIHHAGGQRDHVLQRTAKLHTDQVSPGIDPKDRCHEQQLEPPDQLSVLAGQRESRRLTFAHLGCETRPRQYRQPTMHGGRQRVPDHLGHELERVFFDPLRRADQRTWSRQKWG